MAKKIEKTNAARLLDKAGIKYNHVTHRIDGDYVDFGTKPFKTTFPCCGNND